MPTSNRAIKARIHIASRFVLLAVVAVVAASCMKDAPTTIMAPPGTSASSVNQSRLDVCHMTGSAGGSVLNVAYSAWPGLRGDGDYALEWQVDKQSTVSGDGIHFVRISDAVSAADSTRRAHGEKTSAACRITISVAAGEYVGSLYASSSTLDRLPLFIGVPDVTLKGALAMPFDANLRATGASSAGATTIVPDRGLLASEALVVVADDASGYHGNGVVIEDFRFRSGYDTLGTAVGGIGVGALRVRDLVVRGNHFERTMNSAVDLRASRVTVENNYARWLGNVCGFCIAGPGNYQLTGNRLLDGGFVGLYLAPIAVRANFPMGTNPSTIVVPAYETPLAVADTAMVSNNDFSNHMHQAMGLGIGIRLVTFIKEAANSTQSGRIRLTGNTLLHNTFALSIDANTPLGATSPAVPGSIDVALSQNAVGPSCRNNLLVSFTRISHTLLTPPTTQAYLSNSTYALSLGGDTSWSNAWYDNPSGYGNTLSVDGIVQSYGTRTSPSDNPAGCP